MGGGAILSLGIHHIKGRHSVANQYNIVEVSGWRVVVKSVIGVVFGGLSMVGKDYYSWGPLTIKNIN